MFLRLNRCLKRLPPGHYALLGGFVALATDLTVFLLQARPAGTLVGRGIVAPLGAGVACLLLARRFAESS